MLKMSVRVGEGNKDDGAFLIRIRTLNYSDANRTGRGVFSFQRNSGNLLYAVGLTPKRRGKKVYLSQTA